KLARSAARLDDEAAGECSARARATRCHRRCLFRARRFERARRGHSFRSVREMTAKAIFRGRVAAAGLAISLALLVARSARAEITDRTVGTNPPPSRLVSGFAALDRPVGIAEANVGVLTLPNAEVCAERSSGCSKGDLSFALEAWEVYRANQRFAFGA